MMQSTDNTDARQKFAEDMPVFGPNAVVYNSPKALAILDSLLGDNPAVDGEEEVSRRLRLL